MTIDEARTADTEAPKLAQIRAALPATSAGIYLNTGTAGPLPVEAAAVMADYEARELRLGRADPVAWEEAEQRMDEARAGVAAIVGAGLGEIALLHGATDGMSIAAWSLDWRRGDRAVTTNHEHPGGSGALRLARDRLGVEVVAVDVDAHVTDDALLAAFDAAITPGTRLVSVSHVSWLTGRRLPVEQIAALAHARGALVAIDGAQAAGAIPLDLHRLGADFYAIPGQKWLLGPEGTGALYASPAAIAQGMPAFTGWLGISSWTREGELVLRSDARRFEASGHHVPSVAGLARSCGWLLTSVGIGWLTERGPRLARHAATLLGAIPGVELLTPFDPAGPTAAGAAQMATLVSFRIAGWPSSDAAAELGRRTYAILRALPAIDALRISAAFFTTVEELDTFAAGVAELAAHTPATLPPARLPGR